MEANNTGDGRPWVPFCNVDDLAFRAACNAVVERTARPLKRRVIERLAESPEAQRVFGFAWMFAQNSEPPIEWHFYEELGRSPLWSTLVIEMIAEERKWRDMFATTGFSSIADRLHAFWEKCFGKDASAVTKVASTAIAGAGSLMLATQIQPNILDKITLPIRVELTSDSKPLPVRFIIDSEGGSIPITFKGPNGAETIPVRIEPSIDDKPLKLHFESDGKDFASQLEITNTSISAAAAQLTNLVKLTSNGNSEGLLNRLGDVSAGVHELTRAFNGAVVAETAISKEQANAVTAKLERVAETAIVPHQQLVTTLRANSTRSVVIPSVEPKDGSTAFVKITLCTGAIATIRQEVQVQLQIVTVFDKKPCDHPDYQWIPASGEIKAKDGNWIATVNSFDHRWYGNRSATVTLSPAQKLLSAATVHTY